MKERCQATNAHLRDNISKAIESDVRDFHGSSHLPYQGRRPLQEEERGRLAQAPVARAGSEPGSSCQKADLARRFTRHCVNSAFIGIFYVRGIATCSRTGTY
jgi:hypothetical protein